jgi:hypothetical protein
MGARHEDRLTEGSGRRAAAAPNRRAGDEEAVDLKRGEWMWMGAIADHSLF